MTPTDDKTSAPRPETPDRGVSPIAGPMGGRRGRMIALAAVAAGCGVFLAATWDRDEDPGRKPSEPPAAPRQLNPFEPARRERPPLLSEAATDPDAPHLSDEAPIPPLAMETPPEAPAQAPPEVPSRRDDRRTLAESARRAPVLAYSRSGGATAAAASDPLGGLNTTPGLEDPTALDALRRISPVGRSPAGVLPDRNLLIAAGTVAPCLLQTALDSTTPGYVSCVLPRDLYSDNGAVVLLERGTRLLGEHRGGLQQGRRRIFVLWTRAVSPTGVTVELASPAADGLGRAGFDGVVDTRFWDRFGGALLMSLVDDGAHAAFGSDSEGLRATARLPSDAAATALQGAVDIPPVLRKMQGTEVSIFIARDLDFRGVYRLRAR